jgi:transcriptional regulator with XRE-family HTH domain
MYPHIKDIREDRDKRQKEVAEYLGITYTAYCKYETGQNKIPVHRVIALSEYYNVSVDFLLGETRCLVRHSVSANKCGNRLREIRMKHKLNQTQIAEKINMSQMGYSKYETGEIMLHTRLLIKLSRIYNVSIDYLLGLTDVEERYE